MARHPQSATERQRQHRIDLTYALTHKCSLADARIARARDERRVAIAAAVRAQSAQTRQTPTLIGCDFGAGRDQGVTHWWQRD